MSLRKINYPLGSITDNYYKENKDSDARNVIHMKGLLYNWTQADILQTMADHIEELVDPYRSRPKKVADSLWEIIYNDYDYEDGYKHHEKYRYREINRSFKFSGLCSSLRKKYLVGRNLDWTYDNGVNFVVKTKANSGRHATIGVALTSNEINEEFIKKGEENEFYKYLPFIVQDVINDCHVYVNMNVVFPGDRGYTLGTNPGKQGLCQTMIPRFIADFASSAKEGIKLLEDMDIFAPLNIIGEEIHIMLCDNSDNYIIEFIDNQMKVFSDTDDRYDNIPNNKCILTNSYLDGWNGEVKAVCHGYTEEEVASTGLNNHAMGIERYQILLDEFDNIRNEVDMMDILKEVRYMKSYDLSVDPYWYTEFTGITDTFGDLTIYNTKEDYQGIIDYTQDLYRKFKRDGSLWISAHSTVYDLDDLKITVVVEENFNHKYVFRLNDTSEEGVEWEEL